ncbi:hypothetical protein AWU67_14675 [Microterricola viridarii]|uniref:Uncharacterized protein n=1 Tax=Microterricola viridarii TaxID=412690 RepID=A0A0Y0NF62_9MICO|nr:hypothetical protein AWU67_14675 [Microterricola viridarii]
MRFGDHVVVATDSVIPAEHTFLLVHGIGMGISYFAELRDALLPHGRVVAIDLPGFGDSPEPAESLSMAGMGRLLIDFVTAHSLDHPVLVGHSMGTQVVAEAARQAPDLFPELVLIAPTVNRHERTVGRQTMRLLQDLVGESPKVLALGLQNYVKAGPRWFAKKLRSMMAHRIEETLPHVLAHTLVIRGMEDPVCPHGWAEEVAGLIPGAVLVEIPGRGHETMVKDGVCAAELIADHLVRA